MTIRCTPIRLHPIGGSSSTGAEAAVSTAARTGYDPPEASRAGSIFCDMGAEPVDANAAQRRYWNTVAGPRWVAAPGFREQRNQESLALLLARLGLTGGESVLEIGCGTGALTLPLAAAVGEHGRVVAVDISEPMLGAARQRVAEHGLRNVTLLLGDAQVFAFEPAAFDLATSRMGVMFFADPVAAFRNIAGALKPGGRLVFACWAPLAENRHW